MTRELEKSSHKDINVGDYVLTIASLYRGGSYNYDNATIGLVRRIYRNNHTGKFRYQVILRGPNIESKWLMDTGHVGFAYRDQLIRCPKNLLP